MDTRLRPGSTNMAPSEPNWRKWVRRIGVPLGLGGSAVAASLGINHALNRGSSRPVKTPAAAATTYSPPVTSRITPQPEITTPTPRLEAGEYATATQALPLLKQLYGIHDKLLNSTSPAEAEFYAAHYVWDVSSDLGRSLVSRALQYLQPEIFTPTRVLSDTRGAVSGTGVILFQYDQYYVAPDGSRHFQGEFRYELTLQTRPITLETTDGPVNTQEWLVIKGEDKGEVSPADNS